MGIFVEPGETEILDIGQAYLRIEGSFYCLIGLLFLLYGYYRAVRRPGMSVVLTVISFPGRPGGLGLRPLGHSRHRRHGDLDVGAHRLVPGRRRGRRL